MKFIDKMTQIAEPIIENMDCELVDAEYVKEGTEMIMRFYCEKNEGHITLDECAEISHAISQVIDEDESIDTGFILEVSSPGVERVIKKDRDYVRFEGSKVDVSLFEAVDGRKRFTAVLGRKTEDTVSFIVDEKQIDIPKEKIGKLNLHFDF